MEKKRRRKGGLSFRVIHWASTLMVGIKKLFVLKYNNVRSASKSRNWSKASFLIKQLALGISKPMHTNA